MRGGVGNLPETTVSYKQLFKNDVLEWSFLGTFYGYELDDKQKPISRLMITLSSHDSFGISTGRFIAKINFSSLKFGDSKRDLAGTFYVKHDDDHSVVLFNVMREHVHSYDIEKQTWFNKTETKQEFYKAKLHPVSEHKVIMNWPFNRKKIIWLEKMTHPNYENWSPTKQKMYWEKLHEKVEPYSMQDWMNQYMKNDPQDANCQTIDLSQPDIDVLAESKVISPSKPTVDEIISLAECNIHDSDEYCPPDDPHPVPNIENDNIEFDEPESSNPSCKEFLLEDLSMDIMKKQSYQWTTLSEVYYIP